MTIGIFVYLFAVFLVLIQLYKKAWNIIKFKAKENDENKQINSKINSGKEYEFTPLLTQYEYKNYLGMRSYAAFHDLIICPKVRLADLVRVKNNCSGKTWHRRFNRICAKHVDFVFCDPDMNVKLIVELDDRSHNRADRQERDKFVDAVLTGAGYTIVHIRAFDDAGVEALEKILHPSKPEIPEDPVIKLVRNGPTFEEWKEQQLAQKHPG